MLLATCFLLSIFPSPYQYGRLFLEGLFQLVRVFLKTGYWGLELILQLHHLKGH